MSTSAPDQPTASTEARRRLRRPGWRFWAIGAGVIAAALVVGYIVLGIATQITVRGLFFDSLGMGDAYGTRWHATMWLMLIGLGLAAVLTVPLVLIRRVAVSPAQPEPVETEAERRERILYGGAPRRRKRRSGRYVRPSLIAAEVVTFATLALTLSFGLGSCRDKLLAAMNAVTFGVKDPVFGRDISFYVFELPARQSLLTWAIVGLSISLGATLAVAIGAALAAQDRRDADALSRIVGRGATLVLTLGGLLGLAVGFKLWFDRYGIVAGGDEVIAGAGKAGVQVGLPISTVMAITVIILSALMLVMAVPALWRRALTLPLHLFLYGVAALWAALAVVMIVMASAWALPMLIPAAGAFIGARMAARRTVPAAEGERGRVLTPVYALPCLVLATVIAGASFGWLGSSLYDGIVLRGTKLQVERPYIDRTLAATRAASGLDQAKVVNSTYRQNGVTREAIAAAPASVGSLRFLDYGPTREACARIQAFNRFFTCADVDLDRYTLDGKPRSVFVAGREVDYTDLGDFQRRHFVYTHGYGLVMAPVNEIDSNGRPHFIAGGIPQTGLELTHPEIYFGAQGGMPWAMVDTTQPQFDGDKNRVIDWEGTTGIRVGSGWRHFALTNELGGLPYIGGGRRFWNATKGSPAGPDSQLLLHRDIRSRVGELAPFLRRDGDPYFVATGGRLLVVLNTYVSTDAYPYAASYHGARYMRQPVVATMGAYSGDTHLYLLDPSEPIAATWAKVYPSLFTPADKMPAGLADHLRVGEDLLGYQSKVVERFHVTDVDSFYNNDEGWAPTQEAYGPGVTGQPVVSPVRYTFAVLPGEDTERFVGVRTYKPRTQGRGIGFAGWLAADNTPGRLGKLTLIRFAVNSQSPLDSLDTFTANVARNDELSAAIGVRRDQVVRGNTIVVPVGDGLLYTQPLYLDSGGDQSLPTLWQVVVSFGDGRVFAAPTFAEALEAALAGGPGGAGGEGVPVDASIQELVRTAAAEYEAYRKAFGAGDDEAAARHLKAFQGALAAARAAAEGPATTP